MSNEHCAANRDRAVEWLSAARLVADVIPDENHRWRALRAIGESLLQIGDLDGARGALDAITGTSHEAVWLRNFALVDIGKAQAAAGDIAAAFQTAQAIPGSAKAPILEMIAKTQVVAGDIPGALHTLSRKEIDFDPRSIEITVMALMEGGNDESQARAIYEKMKTRYSESHARITVARFLAEAGDAARAGPLLGEARRLADSIEVDVWAQHCLDPIAWQQVNIGAFAAALETAGRLTVRPEAIFHEVARLQAEAGDFAAARKTADAIPFDAERRSAHINLGKALIESGDSAGGRRLIDEAVDCGGSLGSRISIRVVAGKALAQAGEKTSATRAFDEARRLAETYIVPGHRCSAYSQIGNALAETGDCSGALADFARAVERNGPNDYQQSQIALAQVKAGDLPTARLSAAAMKDPDVVLNAISDVEAQVGDFEQATATAGGIADQYARAATLEGIAMTAAKAGKFVEARRIAAGLPPEWKNRALSVIAECQGTARDFAGAILSADEISDDRGTKSSAYRKIAEARARAGDIDGALSWANSLAGNPSLHAWVLLGVASAMHAGKLEKV